MILCMANSTYRLQSIDIQLLHLASWMQHHINPHPTVEFANFKN